MQEGFFHEAWFLKSGGAPGSIFRDRPVGGVSLYGAFFNDTATTEIYTIAHGTIGPCTGQPDYYFGGRIKLEGEDYEGFDPFGTDPGGECTDGGLYEISAPTRIAWKQITCFGDKIPGWGSGARSVVDSAELVLPTTTVTGLQVAIRFYVGFVATVGPAGGTEEQFRECLATFSPWVRDQGYADDVTDWFDKTAPGTHDGHLDALNDDDPEGPVHKYNRLNGTGFTVTEALYVYDPPIDGTGRAARFLRADDVHAFVPEEEWHHICDGSDPTDCNGNGLSDIMEVGLGLAPDCNDNMVPDECDVSSGTSPDDNEDGIPDECQDIPTVSEWGLIVMTVLAMAAGTVVLGRRRRSAAA
jgi:hypothetical protein